MFFGTEYFAFSWCKQTVFFGKRHGLFLQKISVSVTINLNFPERFSKRFSAYLIKFFIKISLSCLFMLNFVLVGTQLVPVLNWTVSEFLLFRKNPPELSVRFPGNYMQLVTDYTHFSV